MYRVTKKRRDQLALMREAKARKRISTDSPDYGTDMPELRRRIVITDYDHGEVVHTLDLHRTDRIDCYRVVVDGVEWKQRIGWSRILSGIRKSMPRVSALS